MKKKQIRYFLYFLMFIAVIGIIYFLSINQSLSLTEASCSSSGVWFKYTLADESSFFRNTIDTCKENIENGWVGTAMWYVLTPKGNEYRMGGYEATPTSTQKISCGGSQTGKTFVGGYIPYEGAGQYKVIVRGTYYNKKENYSIPHTFEIGRIVSIECPTYKERCDDGTLINTCSKSKPLYCDKYGRLYPYASKCGCPDGMVKEEGGQSCVFPKPKQPEEPPNVNPYPEINETAPPQSGQQFNETAPPQSGQQLEENIYNIKITPEVGAGILTVILLIGAAMIYFKKI